MHARGLLQEVNVTYVATAEELIAAVEGGHPHIEIVSHLDFASTPLQPHGNFDGFGTNSTVAVKKSTVRSIRVRDCSSVVGRIPNS